MEYGSKKIASAAIQLALTDTREEEQAQKKELASMGIRAVAVDYGGDFAVSAKKIIERAIVAAKREGVIKENHYDEGAVAGATKEALGQLLNKAFGLNVGGKLAIARGGDHIVVCLFLGIGLLHLNEVAIGLGHRVAPDFLVKEGSVSR
ncbi:MAG: HutP family protein [Clostridiales bacterium]|nr:HutP family protein [Clostridiales bacterium]